jgi:hypothetical protein
VINARIESIDEDILNALVDARLHEGSTIEYKSQLPDESEKAINRFAATVISFANANGGDLLLGIREENGLPVAVDGVDLENPDAALLRLNQILGSRIEPRLSSIKPKIVELESGKHVFVFRVDPSVASPHRLTTNRQFYGRNSNGRREMEMSEIRRAFVSSETVRTEAKSFRKERVQAISSRTKELAIVEKAGVLFNVVPLSYSETPFRVRFREHDAECRKLYPLGASAYSFYYNADGMFVVSTEADGSLHSCTQIFINGSVESLRAFGLRRGDQFKSIPAQYVEHIVEQFLADVLKFYEALEIYPPFAVFLSIIGGEGYFLTPGIETGFDSLSLSRNEVLFPEIVLNDEEDLDVQLRPVFDLFWNAFGFSRSFSYGQDGRRIKPK